MEKETEDLLKRFETSNIPGIELLVDLALDLSKYWSHSADEIWESLHKQLWEQFNNPWLVLKTVSLQRVKVFLEDESIKKKLVELVGEKVENPTTWFSENHSQSPLNCVAYFCMEFMLNEALPIYSGGLGNVAGDQLKSADDLGIPVVGIGLLYQRGYFHQVIKIDGRQEAVYPFNNPGQLPITPLRNAKGDWIRLQVPMSGKSVWLRAWQVWVGNVRLYLLDSNDLANHPSQREITGELYGGGPDSRLQQEIVLGIGGWRLLMELGLDPEVCHLNEGHSAFALLERTRYLMKEKGLPFEDAFALNRPGNLFTTHTAVPAGFDLFEPKLIADYLGKYAQEELGLSHEDLLGLGRLNPTDSSEPFNMAYLAINGAGAVNGVSRLHGKVSRELFQPLFKRWPRVEIPVGHVTNGVHIPTWESKFSDALWSELCGKDRWLETNDDTLDKILEASDETLWQMRNSARAKFLQFLKKQVESQAMVMEYSPEKVVFPEQLFDSTALTIGFARRFATYKRATLLLRDKDRLTRILTNPSRPVQIVLAGKAHPRDLAGQALIQEWLNFTNRPEVKAHVVFLSDYDMHLAEEMVQGADVWLNNPRRPWEASGTSGMKVLSNGGLNLSVLDGWWDEAYEPTVGWALGDGHGLVQDENQDGKDAEELYSLLENEIVPEFYDRDNQNIPRAWTAKIRNSMSTLTPKFSTSRTLKEYTELYYLPGAEAYRKRIEDFQSGTRMVAKKKQLETHWENIRFGKVEATSNRSNHRFKVEVFPGEANKGDILVELYANGIDGLGSERIKMELLSTAPDDSHCHIYQAVFSSKRSSDDYTARIIPNYEGITVPLENNLILWQK